MENATHFLDLRRLGLCRVTRANDQLRGLVVEGDAPVLDYAVVAVRERGQAGRCHSTAPAEPPRLPGPPTGHTRRMAVRRDPRRLGQGHGGLTAAPTRGSRPPFAPAFERCLRSRKHFSFRTSSGVVNLGHSLSRTGPRALVQMTTGSEQSIMRERFDEYQECRAISSPLESRCIGRGPRLFPLCFRSGRTTGTNVPKIGEGGANSSS